MANKNEAVVVKPEAPVVSVRKPSLEEQLSSVELVCLGYTRIPNTDTYVSYRVVIKNGKIINFKPLAHQEKQNAQDEVKIDFVKLFVWESEGVA